MPAGLARLVSKNKWVYKPHLQLINEKLLGIAGGWVKRLLIQLPPRHGKSEFVSQYFPVWYLGNYPEEPIILSSYEADFAASWGRKARNIFAEWGPQIFGLELSPDSSATARWGIKGHRGGMSTAGVGGAITGKGSKVFIIDDPCKNYEQAQSETYREKTWDWYRSTAYTRLEPDGAMVLIMTRWHEDDLAGKILSGQDDEDPELWEVISLPAIAEENDLLGRKPGEALWPERFPVDRLLRIKKDIGSFLFESLYQQNPTRREGELVKRSWFKFYKTFPSLRFFDEIIQSWDMAFKDTQESSFVVGQVWGRIKAEKYLLDQVRDRLGFVETIQAVRTVTAKWPMAGAKLVEDKANGPAVISTLMKEIPGLIAVTPEGSKESRLVAVSPQIEAGNVFIPDPQIAPWIHDYIEELCNFPRGKYDDQVDATTQALNRLSNIKNVVVAPSGATRATKQMFRGY